WLQPFLNLSNNRPPWAFVADALLARHALKSGPQFESSMKMQLFLQTWNVNASSRSTLPTALKNLLNLAKEYRVSFNAIKLDNNLKRRLPVWLHLGANNSQPRAHNSRAAKCLRNNHYVRTIDQLMTLLEYKQLTFDPQKQHYPKRHCCNSCKTIRTIHKCTFPANCFEEAQRILAQFGNKWNPQYSQLDDGLSMQRPRDTNLPRESLPPNAIIYDPSLTTRDDLSKTFRIFTAADYKATDTANRHPTANVRRPTLVAYTDGSCLHNGSQNARAGAGVWYA
ncbi:hypothetical protein BDW22DRAFT_1297874, partial [Trametopsis cervina]